MRRIAVILTCFNRRDLTLSCLHHLDHQTALMEDSAGQRSNEIVVFLVDDGSTDGTATAVHEAYPEVEIIDGTGELFWNRGMHLAWATALERGGFDHYLLLNDDTILFPDALEQLIYAAEHPEDGSSGLGLAVGATTDPHTERFNYGGYVRNSKWNPMKLRHRDLSGTERVETMNCNAVLVPAAIVDEIG
ncbi:MAG: glycosyltransferase family 2 protein, partial [Acidimicrobiales bacterium]|nr:glycosyltransferase family 2 protein [Acidimicrobiales bacterium]